MILTAALLSCANPTVTGETGVSQAESVGWTAEQPPATEVWPSTRGLQPRRGIVHLHSPWSHDACDGEPTVDGAPDAQCLQDLRDGLCATAIDVAYLTDHPDLAAWQPYADLFHAQDGDEAVEVDGVQVGNRITCEDGHTVLWMPGIEDELMPVGLDQHVSDDPDANHQIYNDSTAEALQAMQQAGALTLQAHTEGKDIDTLTQRVQQGLTGIEIYNLHAMFDPDKREEDLGLDPYGWSLDIAPFTSPDATAEPDLLFLAVHQAQQVSVDKWDALQATGDVVGVAGTDAHQNVLDWPLRDGERMDSYRRMLRWFSNVLLTEGDHPAHYDQALQAGRNWVVFEVLGTPTGFDAFIEDAAGTIYEVGSRAPQGTLHVTCPTLWSGSPTNGTPPEISVTVLKDGEVWQEGCGSFAATGPAVYRIRVDILPRHLRDFLGETPETWLQAYPWMYSNPIRVDASP